MGGDTRYRANVETFWQNIKNEEQQFESSPLQKSRDINQNAHYSPSHFFLIDNISYIYYKNIHNIYYLMITRCNISASLAIESLFKLRQSFCDYCGRRSMTEQAIRDNFILLYELVDEFYDNGYIQIPSVNDLMNLNVIYNQPTLDNLSEIWNLLLTADLIASHTDSSRHRSHNTAISSFAPPPHPTSTIIESPDKNQIFVDMVEYINVTSQSFYYRRGVVNTSQNGHYLQFNQTPIVQTSSIHGNVTMKVFLSNSCDSKKEIAANKKKKKRFKRNKNKNKKKKSTEMKEEKNPEMEYFESLPPGIRLQFNDDLIIGRQNAPPYNKIFGALILDDVSFHKKILSSQREIDDIIKRKDKDKNINNLSFIDNFAKKKILKFFLPNGEEFDIMNYRITSSFRDGSRSRPSSRRNSPRDNNKKYKFKPIKNVQQLKDDENYTDYIRIPFRILPFFNVVQNDLQSVPTIEFILKIRADFPRQCIGRDVIIEYNVPNCCNTVTLQTKTGNRTQKNGQHDDEKPHKNGTGKLSQKTSSDKELSLIKQSAECINITHNAFKLDLTSKKQITLNQNTQNIGIGKTRKLNPDRCQRKVVWRINKFPSGVEQQLKCKFTLNYHHHLTERLMTEKIYNDDDEKYINGHSPNSQNHKNKKKEFDLYQFRKIVSPIAMKFQIDNYNVSGLDIRSLRCIDWTSQRDDGGSNNGLYTTYRPYRWVRRITKSASYVCRL